MRYDQTQIPVLDSQHPRTQIVLEVDVRCYGKWAVDTDSSMARDFFEWKIFSEGDGIDFLTAATSLFVWSSKRKEEL